MEPSATRDSINHQRIFATPQDEETKEPLPGLDVTFPEDQSFEFVVDGLKLKTYRWLPVGEHKGVVIIFHGMNSYVGRTAHVAKRYAEAGFVTLGYDQRGHGQSEGLSGYLGPMKVILSDAAAFFRKVEELHPNLPIFLTGQSFGGALCMKLSREYPGKFKGLVMWNPAILEYPDQKVGKFAARCLGSIIPTWGIAPQSNKGIGLRSKQNSDFTWNDELIYTGKLRPGTIKVILNSMTESHKNLEEVTTPFALVQGGGDKVVDPIGAFDAMDRANSTDKELMFFPESWHDLWHEPEIFEALEKTTKWLLDRVQPLGDI